MHSILPKCFKMSMFCLCIILKQRKVTPDYIDHLIFPYTFVYSECKESEIARENIENRKPNQGDIM